MKRPAAALLGCIAILLLLTVAGIASIPTVQTGTWQPMGSMAAARSGAAAVLLQDHRVLIAGGDGGSGAVNSAEVFNADGSFSAVSAMGTPRSGHVAVVLKDGRGLVAGGVMAGGGATNSAEIYDPTLDSWTVIAGGMAEARSKASASLLQDGRVLIAGGQNGTTASATVEIFDPTTGQFSFAGSLSSPRMGLASASLADGRVLITGGSNGSAPVNSSDIFDPTTNTVSAGPAMTSPRVGHSATALLDGRVLVAGGNNGSADLASAEIYDAATGGFAVVASSLAAPRRDHAAILLPNNNSVLIVGGTSAGNEVATAETFMPWTGAFAATGSPAVSRQRAAVSGLNQDGLLLLAGGTNSGAAQSSAELYGFATVKTDASDYAPGSLVTITGTGWQPGETVTLTLVESPLIDTHPVMTAVADGQGNITNNSFSPDSHDIGIRFTLTAVGQTSNNTAQNTFNDGNVKVNAQPGNVTFNLTSTLFTGSTNCTTGGQTPVNTVVSNPAASFAVASNQSILLVAAVSGTQKVGNNNNPVAFAYWSSTDQFTFNAATPATICVAGFSGNGAQNYSGNYNGPTKLAFTSAPVTVNAGVCSSSITIQSQNAGSVGSSPIAALPVSLGSSSGGGQFFAANDSTCSNAPISTVSIPNSGNSASFFYRDSLGGAPTITASAPGTTIASASQAETVNATVPTTLILNSVSPNSVAFGSFGPVTFTATLTRNDTSAGVVDATVDFTVDGVSAGSATTGAGGVASFSTYNPSALSVASHNVASSFSAATVSGTQFGASTSGTLPLTVGKATPTITWANPADITYGTALSGTQLDATASVPGTFVYTPAAGTVFNAGSGQTLHVDFTPADTATYNNASKDVTINVNKADAVITVTPYHVTYDGNAHTATGSAHGVESPSPVDLTSLLHLSGTTHTDAGDYATDSWTFDGNANYKAAGGTVHDAIEQADAIITVTAYHVTYDGNSHTATGSAHGVASPTPMDLTSLLHLGGTTHTSAGDYASDSWTFDGNTNYKAASGTVHDAIDQADAVITVTAYHVTYNANPHTAAGSAHGVETPTPADLTGFLHLSGTTHTEAGDYPTDAWTFDGNANYKAASGTVHDIIDQADANVSVTGYSVMYNGAAHIATGTATGVGGVDLSAGFNFAGTSHTDTGDYASDPWSFSGGVNYKNQSGMVHDHIDKAAVTATAGSGTAIYDGLAKTPSACSVTGAYTGDLTCANNPASVGPNAGTTAITAAVSGTGLNNFQISYVQASFTIEKAPTTTTVTCPASVTYNGSAQTPCSATVTGAGGLSQSVQVTYGNNTNAGTAGASASFAGDANHNGSSDSKTFAIAKANPTITVTPYNVAYDGLAHTATGTAKGFLNENLSGLNLTGTSHTLPGDYPSDAWVFTDVTGNYNNAAGTVHDSIGYGVCSAAIGPGSVILPPINSDGTSVYQRKGGSTIPVKFRVCAANGGAISNPAAVFAGTVGPLTMLSAVRGTVTIVNEVDGTDIPDAAFRWDASGQQWIFNMGTSNLSSGNTYLFRINLANGSIQFVVGVK